MRDDATQPELRRGNVSQAPEVRLAELVASLSLATDLGRGQPMEQCVRRTTIALRLADRLGVDEPDAVATYYTGLLVNAYCHADAREQVKWFGDDIGLKAGAYGVDMASVHGIIHLLRSLGAGSTPLGRVRRIATFPGSGMREVTAFAGTHSKLASEFAERIGLDRAVCDALRHAYERWDGKGEPNHVEGEQVPLPARIVHLADAVEFHHRVGGAEAAREVALKRSGGQFDPHLVDVFRAWTSDLLDGLDAASSWDALIAAAPQLARTVGGPELDEVLEALGDLVDMKSPHMAGHSRGVANLAAEAGRVSRLPGEDLALLRRAALVHDLGRLGISNAIWDKPAPLTDGELERVRLHPYLTDRMLARLSALAPVRELAARHHERLDGSGYPGGLTAAALSLSDRLLAAADVYHAMTEPRPYRPVREPDEAAAELRAEAKAGRLDGGAVNAVLEAAGHRARARREWPGGLTSREVQVLGLLARGYSNKEIALALVLAPKTVSNHIEHIYLKIGVSTRAAATLFATQHGLVGSFQAAARARGSPERSQDEDEVNASRRPASSRLGSLRQSTERRSDGDE
jgi:HD-GYP domain-containing protein (c-di-GMP phosphodiesterase class II)